MSHTIGVIGTFIRDTIVTLDGRRVESIGGLYHTLAYLASLVPQETVVKPLCHIGADFYERVAGTLAQFGTHVRFDLMQIAARPNTAVTLIYRSAESRDEITTEPMPAIAANEIEAVADVDAILVNLISGPDVELEALQRLKARAKTPLLYLDLHSLTLGIDAQGKRYYRAVPEWQSWMRAVDILQVNELEAATLADFRGVPSDGDLIKFGEKIVAEYVRACHITLGSRGSLLFHRTSNAVQHEHFMPKKDLHTVDIIGCGDAFGAAFMGHFLNSADYPAATRFANDVAGLNCTFMGSLTPEKFQTHVKPYLGVLH